MQSPSRRTRCRTIEPSAPLQTQSAGGEVGDLTLAGGRRARAGRTGDGRAKAGEVGLSVARSTTTALRGMAGSERVVRGGRRRSWSAHRVDASNSYGRATNGVMRVSPELAFNVKCLALADRPGRGTRRPGEEGAWALVLALPAGQPNEEVSGGGHGHQRCRVCAAARRRAPRAKRHASATTSIAPKLGEVAGAVGSEAEGRGEA